MGSRLTFTTGLLGSKDGRLLYAQSEPSEQFV